MILQDLINRVAVYSANGEELPLPIAGELLSACVSLKNKNAELHKELAKLKGDRVFVVNGGENE